MEDGNPLKFLIEVISTIDFPYSFGVDFSGFFQSKDFNPGSLLKRKLYKNLFQFFNLQVGTLVYSFRMAKTVSLYMTKYHVRN